MNRPLAFALVSILGCQPEPVVIGALEDGDGTQSGSGETGAGGGDAISTTFADSADTGGWVTTTGGGAASGGVGSDGGGEGTTAGPTTFATGQTGGDVSGGHAATSTSGSDDSTDTTGGATFGSQ